MGAGQGFGLGAYILGQTLGEEYHKLTPAEMPSHSHTYIEPNNGQGHLHRESAHGSDVDGTGFLNGMSGFATPAGSYDAQNGPYPGGEDISQEWTYYSITGITINPSGGNGKHNNMQPSIVFNKIIKY